jgi:hypothetical protein
MEKNMEEFPLFLLHMHETKILLSTVELGYSIMKGTEYFVSL